MSLIPARVRGLLQAKNKRYDQLVGVDPNLLSKWLGGHKKMDPSDLKRLAEALEATSDYLIGLGENYRSGGVADNYELAAAKMAFAYFERDLAVPPVHKERCLFVFKNDALLQEEGAPRTAAAWRLVARIVDAAIPPSPARFGEARRP